MKQFIIALKNANDKIIEIRMITAVVNVTTIDVIPYNFTNPDAARYYVRQLEQHNGLFSTAQHQVTPPKRKSVKDMSTGAIHPSAVSAGRSVGVSGSYMTRELKRGQGSCNVKGHVFVYLDVATARGM